MWLTGCLNGIVRKPNKNRLREKRGNMPIFYLNLHLYDNYLVENTI